MRDDIIMYAVYYLADQGDSIKDISKKIEIPSKTVKALINSRDENVSSNIKTKTNSTASKDLMIRETSVKGTKSVAIMTKAASEVNDEFKKQFNNSISRTAKNSIYRPNKRK